MFRIRIRQDFGWLDPDPPGFWLAGSGSVFRQAKSPTKIEKNLKNSCFEVLDVLFGSLDVHYIHYRGLGISKELS